MLKYFVIVSFLFSSIFYSAQNDSLPYLVILGVAQDAGYPQIGCDRECCQKAWKDPKMKRHVVSLAIVSPKEKKWWLFEATPDIKEQLKLFQDITRSKYDFLPAGIFITHAHIGHYTGLMELGREALNTKGIPVYTLGKMKNFIENNGPWGQLVSLKNIVLNEMRADSALVISKEISVSAFTVPHRDEYSETAGFKMNTSAKRYLFIPDIDKWSKYNTNIVEEVKKVDIALLDATFFTSNELAYRNVSEVPHPSVEETMDLFKAESAETKRKIRFIHFNHTNPILFESEYSENVKKAGFNKAEQGQVIN